MLTRADLDATLQETGAPAHALRPACHPGAGLGVFYAGQALLHLTCHHCQGEVVTIALAEVLRQPSEEEHVTLRRTPGQIAYEAAWRVHQELYPKAHRVPWRAVHQAHKRGWEAAAQAVLAVLARREAPRDAEP